MLPRDLSDFLVDLEVGLETSKCAQRVRQINRRTGARRIVWRVLDEAALRDFFLCYLPAASFSSNVRGMINALSDQSVESAAEAIKQVVS